MRRQHRLVLALALLLIALIFQGISYADTPKQTRILFLNSYQDGYKWSDDILTGFQAVLRAEDPNLHLQVEYMDTQSTADPTYPDHLLDLYRIKFKAASFDLILSSDDAAYSFLLKHGQKLFPGVPVVFCGVNSYNPATLAGHPNFTGVVEGYDIRSTLETAAKLTPGIKTVYYIGDTTLTGQAIMKEFAKTMDQMAGAFTFKKLEGRNLNDLAEQAQSLPKDSILLMLIYYRDEEGRNYTYSEGATLMSQRSSVPIYGVWDFTLGSGIVGGRLTSGFYQGSTAAQIALRILKGEAPAAIPVITEETTRYAFDYEQLKAYNIPLDRLPPDSHVIKYTGTSKKQLLVLNSYHKGMQWEDNIDAGLKSALAERLDDIDLTYDFLDLKKQSDPVYIQSVYELMKLKYSGRHFDAVLAVDDDAFKFLTAYHDSVFPGTPVVFCGVNYYADSIALEHPWFTGVMEDYDLKGTLDAALALQPGIKRVIVINDTTLTGQANHRNIELIRGNYTDRLTFEFWEDIDMSDIQAQVKTLPKDTIILLMSFNRDKSNNSFSYDDSIQLIAADASVPVYGVWDFYLGKGLLGGMLSSGFNQGETAGIMIGQVLAGTQPPALPVIKDSPNQYMFDQQMMNRYGLKRQNLPPGSRIINAPLSFIAFYEAHRGLVLTATFIILGLTVLVLTLMVLLLNNTLRVRKEFEAELEQARINAEQANLAKGRFLANMSHEIRTPMNGLIGMTDLVLQTELNHTQRKHMNIVRSSAHTLLRVINDILDYSKIEAGKLELTSEPLDLQVLADEVAGLFRSVASQKGLDVTVEADPQLPHRLMGDGVRLRQVLGNLIGNAVKFTENGTVTLRLHLLKPDPDYPVIRFAVEDTGIGIDQDQHSQLFQDFAQFDSKTIRAGVGTGLGLAISKQLVDLMRGELKLDSQAGSGSRFYFDIPLPMANTEAAHSEQESPTLSSEYRYARLLVAEDDDISSALMRMILEKRGYEVVAVTNGQQVLTALKKERFDLILMDVSMPELNGYETTAIIRTEEPAGIHIPIIAMTAYALKGDREKVLEAGMDDYITKPVQLAEIYDKLDLWLEAAPRNAT